MMRKRILVIILWIACVAVSHAQSIPAEWKRFTGEDYLYDIQRERNENGQTELQFKKRLQEAAFASLAKKVQMQVKDFARLDKSALNGKTNISYQSATEFSTNLNLTLADSKYRYDASSKQGEIIVYINKPAASMFYKNELRQVLSRADNAIETAQNYIDKGFKEKAKKELEAALPEFNKTDEPLFWLNFYGLEAEELRELQKDLNRKEQEIKRMLADLQHDTTVYIECKADLFGKNYKGLEGELKGVISSGDCSIVDNSEDADWIIKVNATTREYNSSTIGAVTSYFAYADANIIIEKAKTNQRIYEDNVSIKGGHTLGFTEAGRIAYKNLKTEIQNIIKIKTKE